MGVHNEILQRISEIGAWGALLGFLYFLVAARAIVKMRALQNFTEKSRFNVPKFFVLCIALCSAMRAGSFFLISLLDMFGSLEIQEGGSGVEYEGSGGGSSGFMDFDNTKKMYHNALILTLIFPDVMVVSTYALLVLLYAETFIQCRDHTHLLASFKKQWFRTYIVMIPLFFVIQLGLSLLFISNVNFDALLWIFFFVAAANFVVPLFWAYLGMYLTLKFSGFPHRSALAKTKADESRNVMILWTLGRFIYGIMDIGETADSWYSGIHRTARPITMTIVFVATEIGPFIWSITSFYLEYIIQVEADDIVIRSSMRHGTMGSSDVPLLGPTVIDEDDEDETARYLDDMSLDIPSISLETSDLLLDAGSSKTEDDEGTSARKNSGGGGASKGRKNRRRSSENTMIRTVSPSEIRELEFFGSAGSDLDFHTYKGTLGSQKVMLTIVMLPPTPIDVQKDLVARIVQLARGLNPIASLVPLWAVSEVPSSLWLVRPFVPMKKWLSEQIANTAPKNTVSWPRRVRIALNVSQALRVLHENGHAHGHVSTHCVLLENDRMGRLVAKLSGWEIYPVIKHQKSMAGTVTIGSQTRSIWSPPRSRERWSTQQSDVYGFGLALWSILTWSPVERACARGKNRDSAFSATTNFDAELAMEILNEEATSANIPRGAIQKLAILFQSFINAPPLSCVEAFSFACAELDASLDTMGSR